jgi:hypothetical protein
MTTPGTLREHQSLFARMVADLILKAYDLGFELSLGDAFRDQRCPYGNPNSLHYHRLAIDLNLFKDGVYLTDSAAHEPLGVYWESIGGTWGGRFRPNPDGNHYSLAWGNMR